MFLQHRRTICCKIMRISREIRILHTKNELARNRTKSASTQLSFYQALTIDDNCSRQNIQMQNSREPENYEVSERVLQQARCKNSAAASASRSICSACPAARERVLGGV